MYKFNTKIFVFLTVLLSFSGYQSLKAQDNNKKYNRIVNAWNKAHNKWKPEELRAIYSREVLYYCQWQNKEACIQDKTTQMTPGRVFEQRIVSQIKISALAENLILCKFTKEVTTDDGEVRYPAYLVITEKDNQLRIIAESDDISDRNMNFTLTGDLFKNPGKNPKTRKPEEKSVSGLGLPFYSITSISAIAIIALAARRRRKRMALKNINPKSVESNPASHTPVNNIPKQEINTSTIIETTAKSTPTERPTCCIHCQSNIELNVSVYSLQNYDYPLCRKCQKWYLNVVSFSTATKESVSLYFALKKLDVPALIEVHDGYKTVDISVPDAKVHIEVDGKHHALNSQQALQDLKRTFYSLKDGYNTLRIPNTLVKNHLDEAANIVTEFLKENRDRTRNSQNQSSTQSNHFGYCIRCKEHLELNPGKPLCYNCYSIWSQYENYSFRENHCHCCGKEHGTSMSKPLCINCYRIVS